MKKYRFNMLLWYTTYFKIFDEVPNQDFGGGTTLKISDKVSV
jgi:hypothetical protein